MKKNYAILVDSISTIGSNKNPNIEDVYVLPLGLTDPNNNYIDDITSDIQIEDLLEAANQKKFFHTSSTKLRTFYIQINKLLEDYEKVIYLAISSGLSSQYNIIKNFVQDDKDLQDKVIVVDTHGAGYSIEEMVYDVKELIAKNYVITLDKLNEIAQTENIACKEYIICKNLIGANQGGRLKRALIKAADLLHRVPVIEFDKVNIFRKTFKNYDLAVNKIVQWVQEKVQSENSQVDKICAVYINDNKEKVKAYAQNLAQIFNLNPQTIVYRNLMLPVAAHTLWETFCLYFHFKKK